MTSRDDNFSRYLDLRKEFPWFSFESYKYNLTGKSLEIQYFFNLSDKIRFAPRVSFPIKKNLFLPEDKLNSPALDNLVFHAGMIELVSYWKAACPPEVIIKPHGLDPEQTSFWKKIFFHGLGEFFFRNSIRTSQEEFMSLKSDLHPIIEPISHGLLHGSLVPVGGGKDSAVTMELLNHGKIDWLPFVINPRTATQEVIRAAGKNEVDTIVMQREIDAELLKLNEKGFLNGHTPFSALLAFYSLLAAYLTGRADIVLSNESSANEPTIPGTTINHQYSKSFGFENDFRNYYRKYISPEFNYFSLLRPLSELQIARIFSDMPQYFGSFRSCNAGSATNAWCGNCPKCLFTFIILSPFLEPEKLHEIFGKNLLDEPSLKETLDELTGDAESKPFDCIGTTEEVRLALAHAARKYSRHPLPCLLNQPSVRNLISRYSEITVPEIPASISPEHFVPKSYLRFLNPKDR